MKRHFNIRLEETLIQNLKEKAKRNGTTPTALITQWVKGYCNDTATTSNDNEESDPYRRYSNDIVTTSDYSNDTVTTHPNDRPFGDAIADLQKRVSQLETYSNDTVTTSYLDQRLAQALEPLWESFDYLPSVTTSDDTATTNNDSDDSVTTQQRQMITATTSDDTVTTSNDSDDTATTKKPLSQLPPEPIKPPIEDESISQPPQPLNEANKEGGSAIEPSAHRIEDSIAPSSTAPLNATEWREPEKFVGFLGNQLDQSITIKNLTDRFNHLKRKGKIEETQSGFCFEYKGFLIERRFITKNKSEYRIKS